MPSEEERAEYILNDTGYIYMGFAKQIKEKPWTFGQVMDCLLLAAPCMFFLGDIKQRLWSKAGSLQLKNCPPSVKLA